MGGKAWVAGATNKELRDSDGREMVSAPGPKDCVSEDSGLFRRGSSGRGEREISPSAPVGSPFPRLCRNVILRPKAEESQKCVSSINEILRFAQNDKKGVMTQPRNLCFLFCRGLIY